MSQQSLTTVLMRKETRQLLREYGRKYQTYDDIINELVAKCKKCEESGLSDSGRRLVAESAARHSES
jgi:hypothetical protein